MRFCSTTVYVFFFLLLQLAPFDPTKKKKKKKVVIQEPSDEVDKLAEKTETLAVTEPAELNFTGMKKKKKKQVRQIHLGLDWTIFNVYKNQKNELRLHIYSFRKISGGS